MKRERPTNRRIWLCTDSPEQALAELRERRATGEAGWDMAAVRQMPDPPRTTCRFAVFRVVKPDD